MVFVKNCYCQGKSLDWRLVLLSGTTPPSAFHSTQGFFCIGRRCCRFASIAYKHTSSTRLATLHGSANEFNTEQYLLDYVHIVSGKNSAARFMHLFRIWQTTTLSPCFQAAIIFLFHARSDNQITRRQGINNLTHFIRLFKSKGGLRVHRLVRILESLSSKFAVPVSYMEPIVQTQLPPLEQEGRNHQQQQPDVQQYREESILSMYHPLNNNSQDMQSSGSAQPQISDTSATLAPYLPPSASTPFQFDSTNLTSDIPLWSLPVGFTWSDWETFLQANIF